MKFYFYSLLSKNDSFFDSFRLAFNMLIMILLSTSPLQAQFDQIKVGKYCEGDGSITLKMVAFAPNPWSAQHYYWSHSGETSSSITVDASYFGKQICCTRRCECGHEETKCITLYASDFVIDAGVETEDVTCHDGANGRATITGANRNWSYQWDNGETGVTAGNLKAGTHELIITNDKGCTKTISFNIKEPPAIDVSKVSIETTPTKCYDSWDGTAKLTSDSVTNFSVLWNNHRGEQKPTTLPATHLAKGDYTAQIFDNQGGCSTMGFQIQSPSAAKLTYTVAKHNGYDISCNSGNDGQVEFSINGATPNYQINFQKITYKTKQDSLISIATLRSGDYHVYVVDSNGCESTHDFELKEPDAINVTFNRSNFNGYEVSCYNQTDGEITVKPTGGAGSYQYKWITNEGVQLLNDSETLSQVGAGNYNVIVIDANGCIDTFKTTIKQPDSIAVKMITLVKNKVFNLSRLLITGGVPEYDVNLNGRKIRTRLLLTYGHKEYSISVSDANKRCEKLIEGVMNKKAVFLGLLREIRALKNTIRKKIVKGLKWCHICWKWSGD